VTSNNKTTDKTGPVSLQNNLPNADAGAAVTGSQEGRQEETTNYEIGKTVRAIVHDQPRVERMSLAVMVDGVEVVGGDGKRLWKARDQAELDQIEKLVKSAIGFDEKRGDRLDVVSMPFVATADAAEGTPLAKPGKPNGDLITFVQMIAFGVVGFGIVILTARSIFAALNKQASGLAVAGGETAGAIAGGGIPGISLQPSTAAIGIGQGGAQAMLATQVAQAAAEEEDTMTMNNIQGQLRASSIRKIAQLVDRHPDTTLGIIRGWIATDLG
jgi:flagellar M-ring protein FliF